MSTSGWFAIQRRLPSSLSVPKVQSPGAGSYRADEEEWEQWQQQRGVAPGRRWGANTDPGDRRIAAPRAATHPFAAVAAAATVVTLRL